LKIKNDHDVSGISNGCLEKCLAAYQEDMNDYLSSGQQKTPTLRGFQVMGKTKESKSKPANGNGQAIGDTYAISLLHIAYEYDLHPAAIVLILREMDLGNACDAANGLLSVSNVSSIDEVKMWVGLQLAEYNIKYGEVMMKCDYCRMIYEPFDDIQAVDEVNGEDVNIMDTCPWCGGADSFQMSLSEAFDMTDVEETMDYVIAGEADGSTTPNA